MGLISPLHNFLHTHKWRIHDFCCELEVLMLMNSAIPSVEYSHRDGLIYELRSIQGFEVIYLDNEGMVIVSQ